MYIIGTDTATVLSWADSLDGSCDFRTADLLRALVKERDEAIRQRESAEAAQQAVTLILSEYQIDLAAAEARAATLEVRVKALEVELAESIEPEHEPGCPAVTDDESDFEHLADAGECVCHVREWRRNESAKR